MKIVVIGAGQAGASLVAKLRSTGHQGEITLIGSEPELPYQRPPLSKKYLLGEIGKERLFLRPQNFYDDQSITLALGRSVHAVDRTAKTVTAGDRVYPYDHLVLTTGSRRGACQKASAAPWRVFTRCATLPTPMPWRPNLWPDGGF